MSVPGPIVYYYTEGGQHPTHGNANAAGWDLPCSNPRVISISPHQTVKVPTGIHLVMPHTLHAELKTRSSAALKGLDVRGGIIDWDYRGEIGVIIHNSNDRVIVIDQGQRIAQLLFYGLAADLVVLKEINEGTPELYRHTLRGDKGFGSTGK